MILVLISSIVLTPSNKAMHNFPKKKISKLIKNQRREYLDIVGGFILMTFGLVAATGLLATGTLNSCASYAVGKNTCEVDVDKPSLVKKTVYYGYNSIFGTLVLGGLFKGSLPLMIYSGAQLGLVELGKRRKQQEVRAIEIEIKKRVDLQQKDIKLYSKK